MQPHDRAKYERDEKQALAIADDIETRLVEALRSLGPEQINLIAASTLRVFVNVVMAYSHITDKCPYNYTLQNISMLNFYLYVGEFHDSSPLAAYVAELARKSAN